MVKSQTVSWMRSAAVLFSMCPTVHLPKKKKKKKKTETMFGEPISQFGFTPITAMQR